MIKAEDIVCRTPKITEINSLSTYAKTRRITVYVHNGKGPVSGAAVRFEIVNSAELYPLAVLNTGEDGCVNFLTGYGDLFIHVVKEGRFCYSKIDVRKTDRVSIDFSNASVSINENMEFDIVPPAGVSSMEHHISPEMEAVHNQRFKNADAIRKAYYNTFYNEETAKAAAADYGEYGAAIAETLVNSRGNYREIEAFLKSGSGDQIKWKSAILGTLNKKDLGDVKTEVLLSHLKSALEYKDCYHEDIFTKYLLCPRVYYEMLTSWRENIKCILGEKLLKNFRDEPVKVAEYVNNTIKEYDNLDYNALYAAPDKLLKMKKGSSQSKKILMVSICRTAGIPAMLNHEDMSVEYFKDGVWYMMEGRPVEQAKNSSLVLRAANKNMEFKYMTTYSIGMLSQGVYHTLDITDDQWINGSIKFNLAPGKYRVLTSNRQLDGTVLANTYHVELTEGGSAEIAIDLRKPVIVGGQSSLGKIDDVSLITRGGRKTTLAEELKQGRNIIAWLEVGKEPTEHLLNEILEHTGEYKAVSCEVVLVLSSESQFDNDTLKKVQKGIPSIKVFIDNGHSLNEKLYRDINTNDRRLPLALVGNNKLDIYYISTGYNIGSAAALLDKIK